MACGLHKLLEVRVGDFVLVDVEGVQGHPVARDFTVEKLALDIGPTLEQAINLILIAPHAELPGWHQHHLSPIVAHNRGWRCLGLLGIDPHRHLRACGRARRRW